jgi:hypothetical protein
MMKDALIVEERRYLDSWKEENISISLEASPSRSPKAHCRLPSMLSPSVNHLCLIVSSKSWDGEDLYQVSCRC